MKDLIVCESAAAIVTHYRVVTDEFPVRLGGHWLRPSALCGAVVAWDTRIPVIRQDGSFGASCKTCLSRVKEL